MTKMTLFLMLLFAQGAFAETPTICGFKMKEIVEDIGFERNLCTSVPAETNSADKTASCDVLYLDTVISCRNSAINSGYNCFQMGYEKIVSTVPGAGGGTLWYRSRCYLCLIQ